MSGLISVICLRYSLDFDSFREHRRLVGWYWEILVTWRTNSQQVFLGNDEIHSSLGIIIHPLRQPKEPLAVACFGDGAQNRAWQPTDAWQKWSSMNESIWNLWKIMEACLILELSLLLAEILHQLGINPTLNGGHTRKRFGLLGMCVSVHGFSWVYHGCNRPWLYVGADRIVSSRVWHGLTSFFFHRPLSKHWKSTRLWKTWNCHGIGLAMKEQRPGCIWSLCIQICQGKFQLKTKEKIRYCLILVWNHFSSFTSCRKPPSLPLPSCFHPMSESLGRSTGPTAEHLSNTTNVLQVSNINSTPWFHFQ